MALQAALDSDSVDSWLAWMDSPAGLTAWIGEKFHKCSDHQGRIEDAISLEAVTSWSTQSSA